MTRSDSPGEGSQDRSSGRSGRCEMKRDLVVFVCIVALLLASCGEAALPATHTPLPPAATPLPPAITPITPTVTPVPSTAAPDSAEPLATEATKNILYAKVDRLPSQLDVYAPSEPGPWPVVVVVHGFNSSRYDTAQLARTIASRGAVVFNPNVLFTVPLTTAIERLACAVRFARAKAPDYDGDPSEIVILGISAGAASAVVVGLAGDDFNEGCVVSDGSALPDGVVAFEGPYEFATTAYGIAIDHASLRRDNPELLEAIDPYSHIGRNPGLLVRLIHGVDVDDDWFDVRPEESIELQQALVDAGYDVELTILEGTDHRDCNIAISDAFALMVQQVMEVARNSSP